MKSYPIEALLGYLLLTMLLFGCSPKTTPTAVEASEDTPEVPVVGGDKDEHGCISSAGYQWSQTLEECIRLFEKGLALENAVDPEATTVCYLLPTKDRTLMEVFLPETLESVVLTKKGGKWYNSDESYILKEEPAGMYFLYNNQGAVLYRSSN